MLPYNGVYNSIEGLSQALGWPVDELDVRQDVECARAVGQPGEPVLLGRVYQLFWLCHGASLG